MSYRFNLLQITWIELGFLYQRNYKRFELYYNIKSEFNKLNEKLKEFEDKLANYYSLNETEEFKINHGSRYLKFFERIGKVFVNVCYDIDDNIIATGGLILRENNIWYICDLKVAEEHRGQYIPFRFLLNSLCLFRQSNKIYCISMNSKDENKVVRLSKKLWIPFIINFKFAGNLLIYSVSSEQMKTAKEIIQQHKGAICFLSLQGIKDIILKSTQQPLNLYHVNFINTNITGKITHDIIDGATYMFCFHENDPIHRIFNSNGITTDTSASIIQNNMDEITNWDFIQTSEI